MRSHFTFHAGVLATAWFAFFLVLVTTSAQSPTPRDTPGPKGAAGANSRPAESADSSSSGPLDATVDENTYANRYFRFSLPIPKGWKIVPNLSASRENRNDIARTSPDSQPNGAVSEEGPINLLLLVESAPGKPPLQWNRLMVLANKLKDPSVSIEDHLKYGAQLLRERDSTTQMVGDPRRITIAGRTFWKQQMTQVETGTPYRLTMFATKSKGFSVQFILRGLKAADTERLESVIGSLQFF